MNNKDQAVGINIKPNMTPIEKTLSALNLYWQYPPTDTISPHAQDIRDQVLMRHLDPQSPESVHTHSENLLRDLEIFKQRYGIDGGEPQTYQRLGEKFDLSFARISTIVTNIKQDLRYPMSDFMPFPQDHLARVTLDATCEHDITCIFNPEADKQLQNQSRLRRTSLDEISRGHELVPARISQSLKPKEKKYIVSTLKRLLRSI